MVEINSFLYFDFFAISPSFFYKSKPKIKTIVGSIISIIITLYTIFLFFFLGRDIFRKKTPSLDSYKDYPNTNAKVLNNSNFFLSLVLEGADSNKVEIIESGLFKTSLTYEVSELEDSDAETNERREINFIDCGREHYKQFGEVSKTVSEKIKKYGYCINFNNIVFEGSPLYGIRYKGLKLDITFNTSEYYWNEHIYKSMFPIKGRLYYPSFTYEGSNFNDPFKRVLGVAEIALDQNFEQSYYFTFVNTISKRDDHFFLTKINETSILSFSQFTSARFSPTEENGFASMISLRINFEPFNMIYSRRYIKIQEVLAQVISFSNIGLIIGQTIIHFFNKREIQNIFSKIEVNQKVSTRKTVINYQMQKNFGDSIVMPINSTYENLGENKKPMSIVNFTFNPSKFIHEKSLQNTNVLEEKKKPKPKEKLVFSCFKKPKNGSIFCFCRRITEEKEIISGYLEIEYLLKSYDELKRLQTIFFNSKQLYLFKYLGNCFNSLLSEKNALDAEAYKNSKRYFKAKISNGHLNEMDQKLIDMMSEEDKENFFK